MEKFVRSIEPEYISKNVKYEDEDIENAAKDDRMFNNCKLYCEGAHKPTFRGYFHLISLLLFPYIFWKYWELTSGSQSDNTRTFGIEIYLAMFLVFAGFATILTSALYHTVCWNAKQEILINKMDHFVLHLFSFKTPTLWAVMSEKGGKRLRRDSRMPKASFPL